MLTQVRLTECLKWYLLRSKATQRRRQIGSMSPWWAARGVWTAEVMYIYIYIQNKEARSPENWRDRVVVLYFVDTPFFFVCFFSICACTLLQQSQRCYNNTKMLRKLGAHQAALARSSAFCTNDRILIEYVQFRVIRLMFARFSATVFFFFRFLQMKVMCTRVRFFNSFEGKKKKKARHNDNLGN